MPIVTLLRRAPLSVVIRSVTALRRNLSDADRLATDGIITRFCVYRRDAEVAEFLKRGLISEQCDIGPVFPILVQEGHVLSIKVLHRLGLAHSGPDQDGRFPPMYARSAKLLDLTLSMCPVNVKTVDDNREPLGNILAYAGVLNLEMLMVLRRHRYDFSSTNSWGRTLSEAVELSYKSSLERNKLLERLNSFQKTPKAEISS